MGGSQTAHPVSEEPRMATELTKRAKQELIEQFGAAARASQQKYGVPASITVAQAILESGWGQSELARQANNYFGIKDTEFCEGYAEFNTTEYIRGQKKKVKARFEKYPSIEKSFEHHARLLSAADRYQPCMAVAADPAGFALQLLACGYSTDPVYPKKLAKLITSYDLTRFDSPADAAKEAVNA